MKVIKVISAFFLAILFGFVTTYILSYININYADEFVPFPHFIPNEKISFIFGLSLIVVVYLLIFIYLVRKKYFNFVLSFLGIILGILKYKEISETFLPVNMAFLPGLLEMGKIIFIFMAAGIVIQWIVDGGILAIGFVNKNRK